MGDFANNPLMSMTGLWEEGDKLGCKAGLEVRRADGEQHDYDIVAGGAKLGRMWENDKGRAVAGGSFLNMKCLMFRNDRAEGNQPQFTLSVCKRQDREAEGASSREQLDVADGDGHIPF